MLADEGWAIGLNNSILKEGATEDAAKALVSSIKNIRDSFALLDPYVQAVLIQSVFMLSPTDFSKIEAEYREIIELGMTSSDEWVKRKAQEFQHYPKITPPSDLDVIDFSPLSDSKPNAIKTLQRTQSKRCDATHFKLKVEVRPPSAGLPPPTLRTSVHSDRRAARQDAPLAITTSTPAPPPKEKKNRPSNLVTDMGDRRGKLEKKKPSKIITD